MGELSRRLMVTSGNVTGLDRPARARGPGRARAHSRRPPRVPDQLTAKGKRAFDVMAAEHEGWVVEMFSGLSAGERDRLHALLGRLKTTMRAADDGRRNEGTART